MSSKILSAAVVGLDAEAVEVEAYYTPGLIKTNIVGLPDIAVQEAKERVRSGIKNSGFNWPLGNITVNLAPANLKKEGPRYDLPIALAILADRSEIPISILFTNKIFLGELALNGDIRPVGGVLPVSVFAKGNDIDELFVPAANAAEAALAGGTKIIPVGSLSQLVSHLTGQKIISPFRAKKKLKIGNENSEAPDMQFIRGQEQAKRALEIAAAGGHNVLMTGPPGSGKTLLARTLPSILPAMTLDESLDATKIYSVLGLLSESSPLIQKRPFRAPHHSASSVALVGGGSYPKPGEISLAHRGVLFLDEFSEFPRQALESLRQPLEDGSVTVARAAGSVKFPAQFTLIAARNPCPCGYFNDPDRACTCSPQHIIRYQKKISGPLLDRIDIHITVPRLTYEKIAERPNGEPSEAIRKRVQAALEIQQSRFQNLSIIVNSEIPLRYLDKYCLPNQKAGELLKNAVNQFNLSARAYHRLLKVCRTIADLSGSDEISMEHVAEGLQYRPHFN